MLEIRKIKQQLAKVADIPPKGMFYYIDSNIDGRVPHDHILVLYIIRELMGEDCKSYLEIGVHNGGSMCVVMQSQHPCFCVGVDMFQEVLKIPRYHYFATDNLSEKRTRENINSLNKHQHPWDIIVGNSRHPETVTKVMSKVGKAGVDLLFIDGDHSYDAVKEDFENYGSMVRMGGVVVFDDYAIGHPEITRFVDELDIPGWSKIGTTPNEFIIQRI